jgi:hypothetical protein
MVRNLKPPRPFATRSPTRHRRPPRRRSPVNQHTPPPPRPLPPQPKPAGDAPAMSVDDIKAKLSNGSRDADWTTKRAALAALGRLVDKHGAEWFTPALQRELSGGLLEQLRTERSALVSDACALLGRLGAEHGRAIAPLVERLLPEMVVVAGAGNKTIAKFVRPTLLALAGSVPLGPRGLADVHRTASASKNAAVVEVAARYANVALGCWPDDALPGLGGGGHGGGSGEAAASTAASAGSSALGAPADGAGPVGGPDHPSLSGASLRDVLCASLLSAITSPHEGVRRVGRVNFRLLRLRFPSAAADFERR